MSLAEMCWRDSGKSLTLCEPQFVHQNNGIPVPSTIGSSTTFIHHKDSLSEQWMVQRHLGALEKLSSCRRGSGLPLKKTCGLRPAGQPQPTPGHP